MDCFPTFKFSLNPQLNALDKLYPEQRSSGELPSVLSQVPEPPEAVWIQGTTRALKHLLRLPDYGLAIVGTRRPQGRSMAFIKREIAKLSGSPLIIISGLACGIDAWAHEAALESELPTIGVLGSGLHRHYPAQTRELRTRILRSGGLIISEFDCEMPPLKHQFLQRNRIIAAWARATWVVEAPARSGALNTASWARQLDRSCYATPSFPGDPSFSGTEKLIDEQHAEPYWGAHSLGSTWLDQTGWKKRPRKTEESVSKPNGLVGLLLQQTSRLTVQKGGTTHSELLDWATEAGYSPSEFFNALQCGFDSNHLSEKRGVIVKL